MVQHPGQERPGGLTPESLLFCSCGGANDKIPASLLADVSFGNPFQSLKNLEKSHVATLSRCICCGSEHFCVDKVVEI
jgi:hypothetical protein